MSGINSWIIIVLFFIALLALAFVVSRWRMKRAMRAVIRIFREQGAVNSKDAKPSYELLESRGMIDGMFRGRDYKPHALNMLIKADIIQTTEDGRLYLSEDKLLTSGFDRGISYSR